MPTTVTAAGDTDDDTDGDEEGDVDGDGDEAGDGNSSDDGSDGIEPLTPTRPSPTTAMAIDPMKKLDEDKGATH
ncbi:hypothetical protein TWF481_005174 [Arthrobotrys musiformis]|uniref:Uncharacterized protein n=1 Tax=Arthrobotrys musiformis TaxID=47236 RepID=A0AAV9WCX4_9PEZI